LEFWQNGYGILSKSWTIGEVALLDFMIIITVIGLTLITAFMNKNRVAKQKAFAATAAVARVDLAIQINKYLVAMRTPTTSSINHTTAAAVTSLNMAVKNLGAASKDALKKIQESPSNKQVLAEIKKMNKH
jgi:Tfp pilus assembly major pilin PilA